MLKHKSARCPNHDEPLQIDPKDKFKNKGAARCPVSGVMFEYQIDTDESKATKDKFGNLTYETIVKGND